MREREHAHHSKTVPFCKCVCVLKEFLYCFMGESNRSENGLAIWRMLLFRDLQLSHLIFDSFSNQDCYNATAEVFLIFFFIEVPFFYC